MSIRVSVSAPMFRKTFEEWGRGQAVFWRGVGMKAQPYRQSMSHGVTLGTSQDWAASTPGKVSTWSSIRTWAPHSHPEAIWLPVESCTQTWTWPHTSVPIQGRPRVPWTLTFCSVSCKPWIPPHSLNKASFPSLTHEHHLVRMALG